MIELGRIRHCQEKEAPDSGHEESPLRDPSDRGRTRTAPRHCVAGSVERCDGADKTEVDWIVVLEQPAVFFPGRFLALQAVTSARRRGAARTVLRHARTPPHWLVMARAARQPRSCSGAPAWSCAGHQDIASRAVLVNDPPRMPRKGVGPVD